ncbi:hypothetical protein HPP92_025832 [Vanilla planifolia]|uniref:Uncharacterized protein n=1 Tax=Vanilla planifolia TaxID=51239 RepID=A0A835UAF5_VANPL|nr:hypothetical protein HPP92_026127 [Vanilla planifolia]KAG0452192.1 hypothetical protein HPP92_025832 [Vanilla planifolia]
MAPPLRFLGAGRGRESGEFGRFAESKRKIREDIDPADPIPTRCDRLRRRAQTKFARAAAPMVWYHCEISLVLAKAIAQPWRATAYKASKPQTSAEFTQKMTPVLKFLQNPPMGRTMRSANGSKVVKLDRTK